MSLPNFTAQVSLYRSSKHYRGSATGAGGSPPGGSIAPAYFPGPATEAACQRCAGNCVKEYDVESGLIAAGVVLGCLSVVGCPGAVATGGEAQAAADGRLASCIAICEFPGLPDVPLWPAGGDCCPKLCGPEDPFNPGAGCCDLGEHCVDQYDPNSRDGCCPSDQSVCGGSCCAKKESCCGNVCCPQGQPCTDGVCGLYPPLFPPGTPPPPPPPPPAGGCPPGTWYNPSFGCAPIIH
jgi:hypothetical protein